MVAEASDEGVREQTVKEMSQDHSPWRWGLGYQEGLGMCHSLPHSQERAGIVFGGETSKCLWEEGGGQVE